MRYRKVKYWKVVKSNLNVTEAINILKAQAIQGHLYDYLAIRLKYRLFEPGSDPNSEKFSLDEALSNEWEAIVPDDGKEELLEKACELVKDTHILRASNEAINNMDLSTLWNEIDNVLIMLDDNAKYCLIKHVIDNKLYKKS